MRIFISYHSPDAELAARMAAALRAHLHHQPPREVFLAADSLRAGTPWSEELARRIAEADAFIFLIGEKGIGPWQLVEWHDAFERRTVTGRPVLLPVLSGGAVAPGLAFLKQVHWLVLADPASEEAIARLLDAATHPSSEGPADAWRHTRPYRGLLALDESSSDYFFGRTEETVRVLEALTMPGRLPILIGNSGEGKSSIARAGVFAALLRQSWPRTDDAGPAVPWPAALGQSRQWGTLPFRPGRTPVRALVEAFSRQWRLADLDPDREALLAGWTRRLLAGDASLAGLMDATAARLSTIGTACPPVFLLYVDQAEELYARADPAEAGRLTALIAEAIGDPRLRVLASIRADFYGHLQRDERLRSVWERIDVLPLNQSGLLDVIRRPAALLGASFDHPALAQDLARQTMARPGSLPLLSYLLDDMWSAMQARGDALLTPSSDVLRLGSVLSRSGDRFLEEHPEEEPRLRRIMTLRLVHLDDHGEPMRRRAGQSECSAEEWQLVSTLASYPWRLLVTGYDPSGAGEPFVEVGHEALLREWTRVRDWLTGEGGQRSFIIWKTAVERLRIRYDNLAAEDRPQALLQGYDLQQAATWQERRPEDIPRADLDFIAASLRAEQELLQRGIRQLRESRAMQSRLLADIAWRRLADGKVSQAMALALEAAPLHVPDWPLVAEAENVLFSAVHTHETLAVRPVISLVGHQGTLQGAQYAADGRCALTWSYDRTARLWDTTDGRLLHTFPHAGVVLGACFSPAGDTVLSWSADGVATIWRCADGERLAVLPHAGPVRNAGFQKNGAIVLTCSDDGTAALWQAQDGTRIAVLPHDYRVRGAVYDEDETRVLTWAFDGTAKLWDARDGRPLAVVTHAEMIHAAWLSRDGRRILTASADNTARVTSLDPGVEPIVLSHEGDVFGASFTVDDRQVLSWSADGTARLWDLLDGRPIATMSHGREPVRGAVLSKDGAHVLTWAGNLACVWRMTTGEQVSRIEHFDRVAGASFNDTGTKVLTWSLDGTARLTAVADETARPLTLQHEKAVRGAWVVPGDATIWTLCDDGTVRAWNGPHGRPGGVVRHDAEIVRLASSPTEARILTASLDGTARISDLSGPPFGRLRHQSAVAGAQLLGRRSEAVTWTDDGTITVWDLNEASLRHRHVGESRIASLDVAPSGSHLAACFADGALRVWNASLEPLLEARDDTGAPFRGVSVAPDSGNIIAWTDRRVRVWTGFGGEVLAEASPHAEIVRCSYSPDREKVALHLADNAIQLVDVATGAFGPVLRHGESLVSAVYSPDGAKLVTWSRNRTAHVWDVNSGARLHELRHAGSVSSVRISRDGAWLVTGSRDATVRVWSVETGEPIAVLRHARAVSRVQLSSDETQLLTWSDDRYAVLWDTQQWRERVKFHHDDPIDSAELSADETRLLTWSGHSAHLWDAVRGDKLLAVGSFGIGGEARLTADGRRLLFWYAKARVAMVMTLWWDAPALIARARTICGPLRPLSKSERCRAHLDSEDCRELGGVTEREIALSGDRLFDYGPVEGVGNLTDFVADDPSLATQPLGIEVVVGEGGVFLFCSHALPDIVSVSCRRATSSLALVRRDGQFRDLGLRLMGEVAQQVPLAEWVQFVHGDAQTKAVYSQRTLPLDVY